MKDRLWMRRGLLLMVALILGIVSTGAIVAQDAIPVPVEYGVVAVGTIPAEGATVAFNFTGNAGDLVTVRVVGITPGMDPNLTVYGPIQEPLVAQENDRLVPTNASMASAVFRLFSTGVYTIAVGGTAGDFVMSVDAQPAVQPLVLTLDLPQQIAVPFAVGTQVYAFNTDPLMPMTLHIDSEPLNLNATVEVRDGSGELTALFQGDVDNACVSVAPGDELFTLSLNADPDAAGTITLTLSQGPCQLGPAPDPVTIVVPTIQFVPIPIANVCAASSINNVNIRTGPGREYPVIALWMSRTPIQVVGRNENGSWWAVQSAHFSGWMSGRVVSVTGPCDTLPVVAANVPPPAVTATPGLPLVTPTPLATLTATPMTEPTVATQDPVQPTATVVQPTATIVIQTLEPTIAPTIEATPEVTAAVGG